MSTTTMSDILGYTSIFCWLGAQFPQVVENARRKSVEGLALPFLLNWLLGDFTNLLGCILTHQRPFQTWLAVYFVFVDCSLIGQYAYYSKSAPPPPYIRSRSLSFAGRTIPEERIPHYRSISSVAANVAATAALAAQQEANSPRAQRARWLEHSVDEPHEGLIRSASEITDDEEIEEDAIARLADSFHSEGGRSNRQKHVSWSTERSNRSESAGPSRRATISSLRTPRLSLRMSSPQEAEFDQRGRSLQRASDLDWPTSADGRGSTSRASKRGASMVLLSVWALFGVGTLVGSRGGLPVGNGLGRVLSSTTSAFPYQSIPVAGIEDTLASIDGAISVDASAPTDPVPPPPHEEPSWDRILGRISAWACTTLYLTSRLPQIWKNFVRKSVEGLSMYLFVFAFLGNAFYVSSLLTSPKLALPGAADYIRESIPYILGSGGTLMFDVTIVTQSFLYRPFSGKKIRRDSIRGSRYIIAEEEGLLSAGATGADGLIPPHRRRRGSEVESDGLP